MIRREDCVLLLTEIQDEKKVDVKPYITKLMSYTDIPSDVIKYINDNRQLDVAAFYEKVRRSYNSHKSKLYINLVKENFDKPDEVLTTLCSLLLQISLFSEKAKDRNMFLKHSRFEEISRVLNNYSKTYDLMPCLKLMYLVKSDIKIFESIK